MVNVQSTMMPLGTKAPDFDLPEVGGCTVARDDFAGKPLLVAFICNHCPFVKHIADTFKTLGDQYAGQVQFVAISSNDAEAHPADAPDKMAEEKAARGYGFPYLHDADQTVAHAYTAACTPDFFLFDADHRLVYRGQMDDSRPKRIRSGVYDFAENPATGADLKAALNAVVAGEPTSDTQFPSIGCNIKWKPGNEPAHFNV